MVNYWQYNDTTEAGVPVVIAGTYSSATGSMTWGAVPVLVATRFSWGGGGAATGKVMELAGMDRCRCPLTVPVRAWRSVLTDGQTWTGWVMPSSNPDFSEIQRRRALLAIQKLEVGT